jgi:hypothetical protein
MHDPDHLRCSGYVLGVFDRQATLMCRGKASHKFFCHLSVGIAAAHCGRQRQPAQRQQRLSARGGLTALRHLTKPEADALHRLLQCGLTNRR